MLDEPGSGTFRSGIFRARDSEKADEAPGGLRGGTFTRSLASRVSIRDDGFAEAAIGILDAAKPLRAATGFLTLRKADDFEGAKDAAGAVNIICAPAAVPGAFRRLFAAKIAEPAAYRRMSGRPAEIAKALDGAGGDVGGRRVNHRIVVGEGNIRQERAIIVAVKRTPAAVTILHAEEPSQAATSRGFETS